MRMLDRSSDGYSSDPFAFAKFGWCRCASVQPKNGGRGGHAPHGPIVADFNILSSEPRMKVLRAAAIIVGAVALVATGIGAVVGAGTFLGVAGSTFAAVGTIDRKSVV